MSDNCENTTEIELESLEAIYVNELTYSRNADGQVEKVELLLHPATGHDVTKQYVCMTLVFTVSSKYPDEPPEIEIRNPRGLGEEEVRSLVEDMILKAEEMKGEAMLYTLIEMAKDSITEGNIPHCPCVVCLEHFHQRNIFHRTACYHYFHSRCLYKYLLHAQAQLEVEEKEVSERRHLEVGSSDKDKAGKIICPVCRSSLDEESLAVTCSQEELEVDEKAEEFVIPPNLKEQQKKMAEMFEHQKAKGGIIDLEHEKNKYLLNSEDRMPVRSQRLSPTAANDDITTKSASSKQGTAERNRDLPNSSGRYTDSSRQYRKGRGRGRGNFYSGRSNYEWSRYEDRPGQRPKTEDSTGRRTNYPSGFGSRRVKDLAETDKRTEEFSEQRKTSEEKREFENTRIIQDKERRMKENDRGMRKGQVDNDNSRFNEVHRIDEGFTRRDKREKFDERYDNKRTDKRDKLDERYDNQTTNDTQKVDKKQDNIDRYERSDDDDSHEIVNKESKQIEDSRMKESDNEYKSVKNEDESSSVRANRSGSGQRRSEGRKTYAGGSHRTHEKYYSNLREKENVYNDDDESNEAERTKDIIRNQLPGRQIEISFVKNDAQSAKNMRESENESNRYRSDRFYEGKKSGESRRGERYKNSTDRGNNYSSAVRDEDAVLENDVQGVSRVDRPSERGRNSHFMDQGDEYAEYGRGGEQRIRRGYDKGSSDYQRGSGGQRGRGSGSGPKQRGSKYHEGRGSYAGYSERSHARNNRPQHQQQQQWHRHNRHGEERERVDRTVRVAEERSTEDEMNSVTTGQGACGTDIASETGSKDDEEADAYYQSVRPHRQKSSFIFSWNAPDHGDIRKPVSSTSQYLPDANSTEDETKVYYGINRFNYENKHSHTSCDSEIMGYHNAEDDDNDKIKARKMYPVCSEAELRKCYVGYDEPDEENWDEEIDIYHYERYKIRPHHLEEYFRQAAPRKKYYKNRITEKCEQQNMIEKEHRMILKERIKRGFVDDDDEMESPVKTESKKDVHMKSILDLFKEEKAKELGTSVTASKSSHAQRDIPATLSEGALSFASKVDLLYKSTKQNIGSGCKSQDSSICDLVTHTGHEIPHNTSTHLDITTRLEDKENIMPHTRNNHVSTDGLNRRKNVKTKGEDTKTETYNNTGQGQYAKLPGGNNEDSQVTYSGSSLGDTGVASDVLYCRKSFSGNVAESDVFCINSDVSRRGNYRDSGVSHTDDHTDVGDGDVSHKGDHTDINVSHIIDHRDCGDSCIGSRRYDGVSCRSTCRDGGVPYRDKGAPFTSDNKDSGVSHRDDHTDGDVGDSLHKVECTAMPVSFIKHFKKAPPLKFPKKNRRQGTASDASSQIPVTRPAGVVDSKIIPPAATTSAMLNTKPPASFSELSSALFNSYLASSVLSATLPVNNQVGLGFSPSLLDTYAGSFNSGCLSDLYAMKYNSAQNVANGNSVTTNAGGVDDVDSKNCKVSGEKAGGKEMEAAGVAIGKENINISPVVTK